MGPVPLGQDQEAAVVGDQLEPTILGAKVPAYPPITHAALERRRGDTQLCHPLVAPSRDVPHRLTDLRQPAQIVMLRHLLLIAHFLDSLYRTYLKLRERFACEFRRFHPAVIPEIFGFVQPTALTLWFRKLLAGGHIHPAMHVFGYI